MADKRQEQRRHTRARVKACAWLQFQNETTLWGTVCVDLAQEGVRFSTLRPVKRGTMILLQLQLQPNAPALECKGRACWSRQMPDGLYGLGVRLLDLTEDDRDQMTRFLDTAGGPVLAAV